MKWEVVANSLREGDDATDEIAQQLLAGKTILVTGITNSDLSSWYSRFMTRNQRRLRRRLKGVDASDGYYVWLAPDSHQTD